MKRVLITGRSGYIASSLLVYLRGFAEEYRAEAISLRDGAWRAADFSRYDAVVHCAGLAHIRETAENAPRYDEINRALTLAVAEKAKSEGVGQFIFLSSLSVYGRDEGVLTPRTEPRPVSAYGRSKLAAEQGLAGLETDGFRVTILRPPMVYGEGCKGNYQTLVRLAKTLPVCPNYVNHRSAVSIERLCEYIKKRLEDGARGIFVPQDGKFLCTCEEIRRLAAQNGRRLPMTNALNFGPALLRACTGKGRKAFGDLVYLESGESAL